MGGSGRITAVLTRGRDPSQSVGCRRDRKFFGDPLVAWNNSWHGARPVTPPLLSHASTKAGQDFGARIEAIFSATGPLARAKNFEHRPQQASMARAVAETLATHGSLVVEAGTGVGKSLGYLVPAVTFALETGCKAVISTHTIHLQEQLLSKDLPLLRKGLDLDFEAVLLKGRANYLCPRRLARSLEQPADLFASAEVEQLKRLWEWSRDHPGATLSELSFPLDSKVWAQVCSEPHICTPRTCGSDPSCGFQRTKARAAQAPVVILNHSLFFTHLAGGESEGTLPEDGLLFANDFAVFDEAHTLEAVAARHLGLSLPHSELRRLLGRLYQSKTQKGLLALVHDGEAARCCTEAQEALEATFKSLNRALKFSRGKESRVREALPLEPQETPLPLALARLQVALQTRARDLADEDWKAELLDFAGRVGDFALGFADWLRQSREGHVYWAERPPEGVAAPHALELIAAPIDVAPRLQQLLFEKGRSVIMTSATLTADEKSGLAYFQQRVGATDAAALRLDSPFNYAEQMRVYLPKEMPEPGDGAAYEDALEKWILYFLAHTKGHAFVLFTSHQTLKKLAERLAPALEKKGWPMLVQGQDLSRHKLLQTFRDTKHAVLLGTDSFWQGVDVPGEALSNVIITRLPFAVPDAPLVQARSEWLEDQGRNAFFEYSLPEALLKFRQGVGRLVRTSADRGIIAILDARIRTKRYGKAFLNALPKCPVEVVE